VASTCLEAEYFRSNSWEDAASTILPLSIATPPASMISRWSSVELASVIVSFESRMRRSIRRFVCAFLSRARHGLPITSSELDYEPSVYNDGQAVNVNRWFCEGSRECEAAIVLSSDSLIGSNSDSRCSQGKFIGAIADKFYFRI